MSAVPTCQHIKTNGELCGCPALRNRRFCYFHDQSRKRRRASAKRASAFMGRRNALNMPILEDANAVQVGLMETIDALIDARITERQAGLILYALQTASANLKHTTFQSDAPKPAEPWVTELLTALRALPEPEPAPNTPSSRLEHAPACAVERPESSPEGCHPERSTSASQTQTCAVEEPALSLPKGPFVSSASAHSVVAEAGDQESAHPVVVGAADSAAQTSNARLAVPAEKKIRQIQASVEEKPHAVNVGHNHSSSCRSIVNAKIVNRQFVAIFSRRAPLTASAETQSNPVSPAL